MRYDSRPKNRFFSAKFIFIYGKKGNFTLVNSIQVKQPTLFNNISIKFGWKENFFSDSNIKTYFALTAFALSHSLWISKCINHDMNALLHFMLAYTRFYDTKKEAEALYFKAQRLLNPIFFALLHMMLPAIASHHC